MRIRVYAFHPAGVCVVPPTYRELHAESTPALTLPSMQGGKLPLHLASMTNNAALVRMLAGKGVDVNSKGHVSGMVRVL